MTEPEIKLTKKDPCGLRRRYQKEEQVKTTAKALGMAYFYCGNCKAWHLNQAGQRR